MFPEPLLLAWEKAVFWLPLLVVLAGQLLTLGIWQGIFLFEHRHAPHNRQVDVVAMGV